MLKSEKKTDGLEASGPKKGCGSDFPGFCPLCFIYPRLGSGEVRNLETPTGIYQKSSRKACSLYLKGQERGRCQERQKMFSQ